MAEGNWEGSCRTVCTDRGPGFDRLTDPQAPTMRPGVTGAATLITGTVLTARVTRRVRARRAAQVIYHITLVIPAVRPDRAHRHRPARADDQPASHTARLVAEEAGHWFTEHADGHRDDRHRRNRKPLPSKVMPPPDPPGRTAWRRPQR